MPSLFIGHGSPLNVLQTNPFTESLRAHGKTLPTPNAILAISAHWMTEGTYITHMEKPKTIHDFMGFPEELTNIEYPASGSPSVAETISHSITKSNIQLDDYRWGLDHGTWTVLYHLFPNANIPVLQLSIDMSQPATFHLELGKQIAFLRNQGVMIIGSGNIAHNLREVKWEEKAPVYSWAEEFDTWAKSKIENRNLNSLCNDYLTFQAGMNSVPTPDHYFPLLYSLGATDKNEDLKYIFEGFQNASISMR